MVFAGAFGASPKGEDKAMAERASSESRADTRLLQAVHKTFRLATTRLVDATEKLQPSALRPIIGPRWSFYAAVLHQHHHNEDDSAFPALLAVRPDMDTLIEKLEDDHRGLATAVDNVGVAVIAFEKQPDPDHQKTMHDAIVAVRDLFFPHLDVEDAQIIPAFAQSIPPKQWESMDQEALKSIPRQYLPTAVGAIDEVIRDLPKQERPPPPPLPIRLMLALSWRRKWAAWVKPLLAS
jgi:hemerythrin-like domain-containing protein